MRAVIQRVKSASVKVNGEYISKIDEGLLVLLGVEDKDVKADLDFIVKKTAGLRIFEDSDGKMNLSVKDVGGSIIVVSQFTLMGDAKKGYRPSFSRAMEPETANRMYLEVVEQLKSHDINVLTGKFGADMDVELINQGPVTIILDSRRAI